MKKSTSSKDQRREIRTGDITNSVVIVGDNNMLSISKDGNLFIDRLTSGQRPVIEARPKPIIVGRSSSSVSLLGRDSELIIAHNSLQAGQLLEFVGQEGIGKTTLLRAVSSKYQLPDGMIYLSARNSPLDDLILNIFESFYRSDTSYKPALIECKHYLKNIKALILLDDLELTTDDILLLVTTMPNSSFILTSQERRLGHISGNSVALQGLSLETSIMLVEKNLNRQITSEELPFIKSICSTLNGHPLRLIQTASLVREGNNTFSNISREILEDSSGKSIFSDVIARLTKSEKNILALLANLGALTDNAIKKLAVSTDAPDTKADLEKLKKLGLVQENNTVYQPTDRVVQAIQQEYSITTPEEDVLSYYADWSKRDKTPEEIAVESKFILRNLELLRDSKQWDDILKLTREVSDVFFSKKRFTILKQIMVIAHDASQRTKDKNIEAWTLEYLGFCELGLGNSMLARSYLSQTLELQDSIGDKDGAARTRENLHNLRLLRVFLCHSSADKPKVIELYHRLRKEGFDPWLDKENLLPGQDWQEEIPKAVHTSDVVLVCLSRDSVNKAGYIQKEIKYALDTADEQPEGKIYIIPLKLEECDVPNRLSKWQWVNFFEDRGYEKLIGSLKLRAVDIGAG